MKSMNLTTLQPDKVRPLKIIAVFQTETRIQELFREYLDGKLVLATFEATLESDLHYVGVGVTEEHVLGFDAVEFFLLLLPLLDVAMQFAILGNWMSPELTAATGLLADLQLDAFLFFVLR